MAEGAGVRGKKEVTRFIEEEGPEKEAKPEKLGGGGEGTPLGKITHVISMLNKLEDDHDLLKALHIILYKGPGSRATRKKDIKSFNGYPPGTDVAATKSKVEANKKWTVSVLKDACVLLGLEKGGDREALIARIFNFLQKPHTIAKPVPKKKPAAAKKKPAVAAKKSAKKDGPKKPLSSYMLFAQAVRPQVSAQHPTLKITEVASKIGELWKGLSEGEKNKYKAQAERLKAEAAAAGNA